MELEVIISKKIFYNNGWGIFGCKPFNKGDYDKVELHPTYGSFSIKGNTIELVEGEVYKVELGEIERTPKGNSYPLIKLHMPDSATPKAQYMFIKTLMTTKQFEALSTSYPESKGYKVIEMIKSGEIKLTNLKGIGEKTATRLTEKILTQSEKLQVISELAPIGVSEIMIDRIIEHYKDVPTTMSKIKESLYNLCEVDGLGFIKVDEYALSGGEDRDGNKRIEACINFLIQKFAQEGHSWTSYNDMVDAVIELTGINRMTIENFLLMEIDSTKIINDAGRITNVWIYETEKGIYNSLIRLIEDYKSMNLDVDELNKVIDTVQDETGVKFTEEQRFTILDSFNHGVYVINGKGGTGKCLHGNSLVYTNKGLLKIEDIPKYFEVDSDNNSNATVVSYDENGNKYFKETSKFYNMGLSKTFKIKTSQGFEIEGTPEHPLLVVNENGDLEFKQLRHFNGKEVLPISINNQLFGDNESVNENIAYFMGLLTGDGTTTYPNYEKPIYTLTLTNSIKEISDSFVDIAEKEFGVIVNRKVKKYKNSFDYGFHNKDCILKLRDEYGPSCTKASGKKIPESIMTAPKNVVVSFLQGLFDTDGSFTDNSIELCTASKELSKQLQVILLNFGIVSKLRIKKVKGYEQNYYILTIYNKTYIKKFYEEIGFKNEPNKKTKLEKYVLDLKLIQNDNVNILTHMNDKIYDIHKYLVNKNLPTYNKPGKYKLKLHNGKITSLHTARELDITKRGHRKSCSSKLVSDFLITLESEYNDIPNYDYLKNVTNNLYIDYVESIEESESVVYDFTVPETHSFVANGIINHNTTIMKGITDICEALNLTYKAMALSGRASQLLTLKKIDASTIHRALGTQGSKFLHDSDSPMPYDVIIIEESSMVNASLVNSILKAVKPGAKVIFVGDSGQLSGIGYGDVLRDLLKSNSTNGTELVQIHRQAEGSGIIQVAGKVRNGEHIVQYAPNGNKSYQVASQFGEQKDFTMFTFVDNEVFTQSVFAVINKQLSKLDKDNVMDFQILVSNKKRGKVCSYAINTYVQDHFKDNIKGKKVNNGTYDFYVGDKVIVNGNTYNIVGYHSIDDVHNNECILNKIGEPEVFNLYNGTMGIIEDLDMYNGGIIVKFEGMDCYLMVSGKELRSVDLGYAITIHKSQGMTIKSTLTILDSSAYKLLSRQLLYTGITRASNKAMLIAEHNSLYTAVKNDASGIRRTFLGDLLKQGEDDI